MVIRAEPAARTVRAVHPLPLRGGGLTHRAQPLGCEVHLGPAGRGVGESFSGEAMSRIRIDLDKHRSPGVRCFSGEDRAQAISDCYPAGPVTVFVPEDVLSFTNSFVRGFHHARPDLVWEVPDEDFRERVEVLSSRCT